MTLHSAIGSRIVIRDDPSGIAAYSVEYERSLSETALFTGLTGAAEVVADAAAALVQGRPGETLRWLDRDGRAQQASAGPWRVSDPGVWQPTTSAELARVRAEGERAQQAWDARCPAVAPEFASVTAQAWTTLGFNTLRLRSRPADLAVVPSKLGYVGAWQWDAYFIALGLRHGDPELARQQLRLVTDPQAADGQLPDVVHDDGVLASSADLPLADQARLAAADSPYAGRVVPLTKPPLLAWTVAALDRDAPDLEFLETMLRRADANHGWWLGQTDRSGLPAYAHPYSSGLDDSPTFDLGPPRPTADLLAYLFTGLGVVARLRPSWPARGDSQRLRDALAALPATGTIVDLLGLVGGHLPAALVEARVASLDDPGRHGGAVVIPTVGRDHPSFDAGRMWRGPVWLNTNVLVAQGLRDSGYPTKAATLDRRSLELVQRTGPYEYFDADTGQPGRGAVASFSWTAALTVELAVRLSGADRSAPARRESARTSGRCPGAER